MDSWSTTREVEKPKTRRGRHELLARSVAVLRARIRGNVAARRELCSDDQTVGLLIAIDSALEALVAELKVK